VERKWKNGPGNFCHTERSGTENRERKIYFAMLKGNCDAQRNGAGNGERGKNKLFKFGNVEELYP